MRLFMALAVVLGSAALHACWINGNDEAVLAGGGGSVVALPSLRLVTAARVAETAATAFLSWGGNYFAAPLWPFQSTI